MSREALISRRTQETDVRVKVVLDGSGTCSSGTGIGFFDHMLDQIARHGLLDIEAEARGDLHVDGHHVVEDIGITLGQALKAAVGDAKGIRRYGHAFAPMDEALAFCAMDWSGRPYLHFVASFPRDKVGDFFDTDLVQEFFRAVALNAGITLHLRVEYGQNAHHMVEACFKAFAKALDDAKQIDDRVQGVPSSKGTLLGQPQP